MTVAEELEKKLRGGKFRLLNEKMYKGKELTPTEIKHYHTYYSEQARRWPHHPEKRVLAMIEEKAGPDTKIADLGCGDAKLAAAFPNVSSFDKHPTSKEILKAELDAIPVEDKSFDIAVHSLSLMTNYISKIVKETNRILKVGGEWYIAEVRSRLKSSRSFISGVEKFGFKFKEIDTENTHFVIFVFTKTCDIFMEGRLPEVSLKPCLYKKR